jgi:hypothetical protein
MLRQFPGQPASAATYIQRPPTVPGKGAQYEAMVVDIVIPAHLCGPSIVSSAWEERKPRLRQHLSATLA